MPWRNTVNGVLDALTGHHIARAVRPPSAEELARHSPRPPTRPGDRLLEAPVFIISSLRSGSTLLRAMLNAHSMLHAPHELHVRRLTVDFGTPTAERAMDVLELNRSDLEHLLWDRVLHRELTLSGKRFLVEKTPANAFVVDRIKMCWPDARFLFLLRHPASIATSWWEANPDSRTPEEAAAHALGYMEAVESARETFTGLTVRYEDLTDDPETEAHRICDFLEIPREPGLSSYGEQDVVAKGLGDWRGKIRSGEVQPGRALPDPETVPELLRPISRAWGYLDGPAVSRSDLVSHGR
jgi:hypothetical protein